jgi:hypothetical protein
MTRIGTYIDETTKKKDKTADAPAIGDTNTEADKHKQTRDKPEQRRNNNSASLAGRRAHKEQQINVRKGKAKQDKTRQDKTGQDKTREYKTRQDKTRQGKARQDKTRQDKTRNHDSQVTIITYTILTRQNKTSTFSFPLCFLRFYHSLSWISCVMLSPTVLPTNTCYIFKAKKPKQKKPKQKNREFGG